MFGKLDQRVIGAPIKISCFLDYPEIEELEQKSGVENGLAIDKSSHVTVQYINKQHLWSLAL